MTCKKITPDYQLMLGAFFLTAVITSCNNGTEKKDAPADTPKVSAPAPPVTDTPQGPIDTTNMKEAETRPVKTTD